MKRKFAKPAMKVLCEHDNQYMQIREITELIAKRDANAFARNKKPETHVRRDMDDSGDFEKFEKEGWIYWRVNAIGLERAVTWCLNEARAMKERRAEGERLIAQGAGDESALLSISLPDEEADRSGSNDNANYSPLEGDFRQPVEGLIKKRRGWQQFRDALRKRYGNRCVVTGCEVLAVLEAAHIIPYRSENDNHPENGLLLRADIHTLFDLDLLAIEPEQLQVDLHPNLAKEKEYGHLTGKVLGCARGQRPSQEALRVRYKQFQKRARSPE
jgi:hypothetical protein